jgi:hypothetical protein
MIPSGTYSPPPSDSNKNVDINSSAHDTFLELPSSGMHKSLRYIFSDMFKSYYLSGSLFTYTVIKLDDVINLLTHMTGHSKMVTNFRC